MTGELLLHEIASCLVHVGNVRIDFSIRTLHRAESSAESHLSGLFRGQQKIVDDLNANLVHSLTKCQRNTVGCMLLCASAAVVYCAASVMLSCFEVINIVPSGPVPADPVFVPFALPSPKHSK